MKQVSITQAVKITKKRVKSFDDEKEYLSTGDLNVNVIKNLEPVTYENRPSRADLIVDIGDLIVARMQSTKKVMLISEEEKDIIVSTGFLTLESKEGWNNEFLYFYFNSSNFQDQKDRLCTGATQKAINNAKFKEITIPEISLEDQKKLVKSLRQADKIGENRRKAIDLLDDYLKSVFLEMFGDPVLNEKEWEVKKLGEISESRLGKMRDKQFITGNFLEKYLGNSNVKWFNFDFSNLLEMDFIEEEKEKFSLEFGDLLICEGGEIGRCAIWKNQKCNCFFQKAIHRVRTNKNIVISEYLQWVFWFYSKGNAFKESRSQATIAHLTGVKLKRLPIPIPCINLQTKFAEILQKTERIKQAMLSQSEELDTNFNALVQGAFSK